MTLAMPASVNRCLFRPQNSIERLITRSSPSPPCSTVCRSISTTPLLAARGFANPNLNAPPEVQPPYPHGPERWFKSANRGLYGNVRVRTGNNVSEEHQTKTRRRWYPNVHNKRLWSECLERFVRVRVVIRVLRTIDKAGGLDNYLLGQTPGRVRELGTTGWALRWRIIRTEKGKQKWEEERRKLGLTGTSPRDDRWVDPLAQAVGTHRGMLPPVEAEYMTEDMLKDSEEILEARDRAIDEELDAQDKAEDGGIDLTQETVQPGRSRRSFVGLFNKT